MDLKNTNNAERTMVLRIGVIALAITLRALCPNALGQDPDSLRKIWTDLHVPDSVRLKALKAGLEPLFQEGLPDSAIAWAGNALVLAKKQGDPERILKGYHLLGTMYGRAGRLEDARRILREGLDNKPLPKNRTVEGNILLNIGVSYQMEGAFPLALEHTLKALDILESEHDSAGISNASNNLGSIYVDNGQPEKALPRFQRALDIFEARHDPRSRNALVGMAKVRTALGDTTGVLALFDRAMAICDEVGDRETGALVQLSKSQALSAAGKYAEAMDCIQRSRSLTSNPMLELRTLIEECELLERTGQYAGSLKKADQAISLGVPMQALKEVRDVLEIKSTVLGKLGDVHGSFEAYKQYITYKDSLFNEEQVQAMTSIDLEHGYRVRMLADSLANAARMEEERLRNNVQLADEEGRRNTALAGIAGAVLLALALWSRLRRSKRNAALLEEKNVEIIDAQGRLVQSEKQREAEQVRTRIARDVHDELGSDLTKLALLSSEAKRRAAQDPASVADVVDRMGGLSRTASSSLSDIVWAVDPAHDTVQDLVEHARTHAARMLDGTGIKAHLEFTAEGPDRAIDPATKRDIFLLLKEALNNAIKHSGAKNIHVSLVVAHDRFSLRVKDDGVGFLQDAGNDEAGNGLGNMRGRAKRLGAALHTASTHGQGVELDVEGALS